MTASQPLKILLCGKFPSHVAAVSSIVPPDFEVVHHSSSNEDAIEYLTSNPTMPINLAIMGGGFSPSDFETVQALPGAKTIPWMRPFQTKPGYAGPPIRGAPTAEEVAGRVRKGLEENVGRFRNQGNGTVEVEGWEDGQVWYF